MSDPQLPLAGKCAPKSPAQPNLFYFAVPPGCPEAQISYGRSSVVAKGGYVVVINVDDRDISLVSIDDFVSKYSAV
jgi:hypothetical protein